jgi:hypothetical protein
MKLRMTTYISSFKINSYNTLAVLIFFFSSLTVAQTTQKLNVTVSLKIKDGDMKNSLVTITRVNEPFKILDPSKGESIVDLPLGYEYQFAFTKLGYATKSIIVDTHVPENRELKPFKKQVFKVELEKEATGGQSNVKIAYNMSLNDFDFYKGDFSKTEKVNAQKNNPVNTTKPKENTTTTTPQTNVNPEKQTQNNHSKIKDKKVIQQDSKKITIITINSDGKDYIYKKEEFSWGGTFFYKNDVSITESTFINETE